MKTKLVLWGTNEQDQKVLIAMELRPKDNKVDIWTFPETVATDEFAQAMLQDWRNGKEIPFPEEKSHIERALTVSDSLLPDTLKVERGDIVNRAQTEWHFIVLSSKLNEVYQTELAEFQEKIGKLTAFDANVWDGLKGFWSKVQEQVRERNLFRDHANALRDNTNALFGKMKELRSALDNEFKALSKEHHGQFLSTLENIEAKIKAGVNLPGIFEELKKIQRNFRDTKLTREHRSQVWEKLDGAFKAVKERRFGPNANQENSPLQRLKRRYDGLIGAIEKMQKSIDRDKDDLAFQDRKIANSEGQLEAQIRQAKIKMIHERIESKELKLKEMKLTKKELEDRMESEKIKEAKRAEQNKIKAAQKAAKEKIAAEIKLAAQERAGDKKIEKAAEAISANKDVPKSKVETAIETIAVSVETVIEDVVDTVKAVAEVVENKIDDVTTNLKENTAKAEMKSEEEE